MVPDYVTHSDPDYLMIGRVLAQSRTATPGT